MVASVMLQGTGSDVGKSLLTAGLARAYAHRGLRVRPFKPQNMSNNAAVTADGGEIGRAQALQARAAGVPTSVHMNPVLLKPQSAVGSQVVVQGRVIGSAPARDYQKMKPRLMNAVLESYRIISSEADLVLVEGAGSPAEINLRQGDIANMGFAETADVPVILIGDIDRGGVIASLVGTAHLLPPPDRARLAGFIVNRFRGDPALFEEGMRIVADRSGMVPLGLVPFFPDARDLPAEDSVALERPAHRRDIHADAVLKIAVPVLGRIANFDDLDPLVAEPLVNLVLVRSGEPLPPDADVVLLPGSKATLADLAEFRAEGWDIDLKAHWRRGGEILGLCGGYQMLGRKIADPEGIEGEPGAAEGLGLLDIETLLGGDKRLVEASGSARETGAPVRGYEMHIGISTGPDRERPLLDLVHRPEGAVSVCGRVSGTYLHGLFTSDEFRGAWLKKRTGRAVTPVAYESRIDEVLDGLAAHLETHLDLDGILKIARTSGSGAQLQEGAA